MSRQRLPNRRRAVSETLEIGGHAFTVSAGFDDGDQVKEIFVKPTARADSMLSDLLDDSCTLISIMLQSGSTLADIRGSISRSALRRIVDEVAAWR